MCTAPNALNTFLPSFAGRGPTTIFRLSVLYTLMKEYDKAIPMWKRYVDVTNGSPTAYSNLGLCYELAGKLADAEAYRLDLVGKANAGQMEREGALIARYPLLIQKTVADKLSDKVQVIIAPTPAAGQFIGSSLVGASHGETHGEAQ